MPRSTGTMRYMRQQAQGARVRSQLQGVAGVRKLIRQLPPAVKAEMADALTDIAPDFLADAQAKTPVATVKHSAKYEPGALKAALSWKVLRASLRLRIGLLTRGKLRDFFYGRIVEFGRKAQTVTVTRKAGVAPYKLRVRAMAARHFIFAERPQVRQRLRNRLNVVFDHALAQASVGTDIDG